MVPVGNVYEFNKHFRMYSQSYGWGYDFLNELVPYFYNKEVHVTGPTYTKHNFQ